MGQNLNRRVLWIVLFLLIITFSSARTAGFSPPIREFIRGNKELSFELHRGQNFVFTPVNDITAAIYEGDSIEKIKLKAGVEYRVGNQEYKNSSFLMQIFASEDRNNIESIRDDLLDEGFSDLSIIKEDILYKLVKGPYFSEQRANQAAENLIEQGKEVWIRRDDYIAEKGDILLYESQDNFLGSGASINFEGPIIEGDSRYPGLFSIKRAGNNMRIVNTLDINKILCGILENRVARLSIYNNPGSYQTGAVIYRSALLKKIEESQKDILDIADYKGWSEDNKLIKEGVESTEAYVIKEKDGYKDLSARIYSVLGTVQGKGFFEEGFNEISSDIEVVDLKEPRPHNVINNARVALGLDYSLIQSYSWIGPRSFTVLELNYNFSNLFVEPVLAGNSLYSRKALQDIVTEKGAIAAVNGGYFDARGYPLGLMVKGGEVISEPIYNRTALGITEDGEVIIERLDWEGFINDTIEIKGVNRPPGSDDLIIFNRYYDEETPEIHKEARLIVVENDTVAEVHHGIIDFNNIIPQNGYVIAATGDFISKVFSLLPGKEVGKEYNFSGLVTGDEYAVDSALSAGPRLLKEGEVFITGQEEKFQDDILQGRAPRSAVGLTEDNKLIFVTVDGRQPEFSIGVSLKELSELLKELGAVEAMNLDGGDSAGMVIRNFLVNNPRSRREVGNSLIITRE